MEALENAPSKGYTRENFEKMVGKRVNHKTIKIRKEMIMIKKDIVKEIWEYANIVQAQASRTMGVQLALLKKQLAIIMQYIDCKAKRPKAFAIKENMDLSNK